MTAAATATKITSVPHGWPTDKRSRTFRIDDIVFISHPERKTHLYDDKLKKWREVA